MQMTADLGIGANMGVESAASLCNVLQRELKSNPNRHPSQEELSAMFTEYQNDRFDRAKAFVDLSGAVTRMNSYQSLFGRFFVSYLAPYFNEKQFWKFAEGFAKGPKLNYAPSQTLNDDAEGWKLANKGEEKKASTGWLTYVLLTSTIGITVAYVAKARLSSFS